MNELRPAPIVLTAALITLALGVFNLTYGKTIDRSKSGKTLLADLAPEGIRMMNKKSKSRGLAQVDTESFELPVERAPKLPKQGEKVRVMAGCSAQDGAWYTSDHPLYEDCLDESTDGKQTLGRMLLIRIGS